MPSRDSLGYSGIVLAVYVCPELVRKARLPVYDYCIISLIYAGYVIGCKAPHIPPRSVEPESSSVSIAMGSYDSSLDTALDAL